MFNNSSISKFRFLSHETSLTPSLFNEVPVPSQESEQSWICRLNYRYRCKRTLETVGHKVYRSCL